MKQEQQARLASGHHFLMIVLLLFLDLRDFLFDFPEVFLEVFLGERGRI